MKTYLAGHGVGAAASTLRATGAWKADGLSVVRLGQTVGGLRVPGTDVKAVFNAKGALVSVVENTARISGTPAAPSASEADALRAAVAALYPRRSVSATSAKRSGNVTTYARRASPRHRRSSGSRCRRGAGRRPSGTSSRRGRPTTTST